MLGLVIGFAGVLLLVARQVFAPAGTTGGAMGGAAGSAAATALAAAAALAATLLYGITANYTKRKLSGVDPLLNAAGTMIGATVLLTPALATWPAVPVSTRAWTSVLALGILCTGVAYLIFFHLIAHVGPSRTITVTFVIPIFGIFWGAVFLDETVAPIMLAGCAVVLIGTALATGAIRRIPGLGSARDPAA